MLFIHQFRNPSAGGTEVYGQTLARALARHGAGAVVVSVEHDPAKPDYSWSDAGVSGIPARFLNTPEPSRTGFDSYHDDPLTDLRMTELVRRENPDVLHILHLSGLSSGWLEQIPRPGPFVALTLADHWLYCARGQLLDSDLRLCTGPEAAKCAGCLGFSRPFSGARSRWESGTARVDNRWLKLSGALGRVDLFVSPSRDTADRHVEEGLVSRDRLVIQDYGFELPAQEPAVKTGRRRIGFIGTLMHSKGVHVLLEAFSRVTAPELELHLFGEWSDYHERKGYRKACAPWLEDRRVTDHGPVRHDRIAGELEKLDLLAVPSIWPENSPLVVHEAFQAGVPVMASGIGGLNELVRPGLNGWLVPPGDWHAWETALTGWASGALQPGSAADAFRVRSIDEDAESLIRLYGGRRHAA